ncbi:unnamed protein product [Didymodactylos carnosus]|uniref:Uncharacterized protein n=1 Tax=Didymodactylos carnosus TaxID=1234261 RepID=A0A815ZMS5_9BILA|nr:unnamed protein product [Didymodactylos carnosus]CAF4454707.1 unnamed protein product [Didymodactylos carnosus]
MFDLTPVVLGDLKQLLISLKLYPTGPTVCNPTIEVIDFCNDLAVLKYIEHLYYIGFVNKSREAHREDYLGVLVKHEEFINIFGPDIAMPNIVGYSKAGILNDNISETLGDTFQQRLHQLYDGNLCDVYEESK